VRLPEEPPSWDGVDRRWNNQLVVPALQNQLYEILVVDPNAPAIRRVRERANGRSSPSRRSRMWTRAIHDWCTTIKLYCAGKADGVDEAPPWEPKPAATRPAERATPPAAAAGRRRVDPALALRGRPRSARDPGATAR